jgi:hypothetical protein
MSRSIGDKGALFGLNDNIPNEAVSMAERLAWGKVNEWLVY